jgi:hypothetical protein
MPVWRVANGPSERSDFSGGPSFPLLPFGKVGACRSPHRQRVEQVKDPARVCPEPAARPSRLAQRVAREHQKFHLTANYNVITPPHSSFIPNHCRSVAAVLIANLRD